MTGKTQFDFMWIYVLPTECTNLLWSLMLTVLLLLLLCGDDGIAYFTVRWKTRIL